MTSRAAANRLGLADGSGVSRTIAQLYGELSEIDRLQRAHRRAEEWISKH